MDRDPHRPRLEVLDIGPLAAAFMRYQRSMRVIRMIAGGLALLLSASLITSPAVILAYRGERATAVLWAVGLVVVVSGLSYGLSYLYRRGMAGSRRAAAVMFLPLLALYSLIVVGVVVKLALPALPGVPGNKATAAVGLPLVFVLGGVILLGWLGIVRSRTLPGAELIVDRNYVATFGRLRGQGRELLRVMGIPILPGQPIAATIVLMALLAFGLEGATFNAFDKVVGQMGLLVSGDAMKMQAAGVAFVATLVIVPLMLVGSRRLRRGARRRALLSAEVARQFDPRPPVLFLRAFRDDQVSLKGKAPPLLMRLIDPGSVGGTLEELVVQEFAWLGPVVAIGNPGDPPPVGVSRMYCEGDTWQETVDGLMRQAARIIVAVEFASAGDPDGVPAGLAWEITRLRDNGVLHKTTFLWPPGEAQAPDALARLLALIDPAGEIAQPDGRGAALGDRLSLCVRASGDALLLSAPHATEIEYTLALRVLDLSGDPAHAGDRASKADALIEV